MDFNSFLQYIFSQMPNFGTTPGSFQELNPDGSLPPVPNGPIEDAINRTGIPAAAQGMMARAPLQPQDTPPQGGGTVPPPTPGENGGPPLANGPQLFPGSRLTPSGPTTTNGTTNGFQVRPPAGAGAATSDATRARNRLLFADADPRTAMANSMMDAGLNPYQANPFMEMIMDSAPGLQASFLMSQAQGGATPGSVDAAGGMGGMLRDHMTNALTSGNIGNTLSASRGNIGNVPLLLDQFALRRAKGELGMDENPFMGLLEAAFSNPEAAQAMISGLTAPGLGSNRLAASYNRGLGAAMQGAVRRQAGDYGRATTPSGDPNNPALGSNFWSYIWGGPRG